MGRLRRSQGISGDPAEIDGGIGRWSTVDKHRNVANYRAVKSPSAVETGRDDG
jgi:hypothetical protein